MTVHNEFGVDRDRDGPEQVERSQSKGCRGDDPDRASHPRVDRASDTPQRQGRGHHDEGRERREDPDGDRRGRQNLLPGDRHPEVRVQRLERHAAEIGQEQRQRVQTPPRQEEIPPRRSVLLRELTGECGRIAEFFPGGDLQRGGGDRCGVPAPVGRPRGPAGGPRVRPVHVARTARRPPDPCATSGSRHPAETSPPRQDSSSTPCMARQLFRSAANCRRPPGRQAVVLARPPFVGGVPSSLQ